MSKNTYLHKISEDSRFEYYGKDGVITYAVHINNGTEYFINQSKGVVVCVIKTAFGNFTGKSKVHDKDTFDLTTGMTLSRYRATLKMKRVMLKNETDKLPIYKQWLEEQEQLIFNIYKRIKDIEKEIQKYK